MSNVTLEQTTLPVIDICELANAVMEDFKANKLHFGKPQDEHVISSTLGYFIGQVLEKAMEIKWANGNGHLISRSEPASEPIRFRCPVKKVFAKLSAKGKCSVCGRIHALEGNGHHVA